MLHGPEVGEADLLAAHRLRHDGVQGVALGARGPRLGDGFRRRGRTPSRVASPNARSGATTAHRSRAATRRAPRRRRPPGARRWPRAGGAGPRRSPRATRGRAGRYQHEEGERAARRRQPERDASEPILRAVQEARGDRHQRRRQSGPQHDVALRVALDAHQTPALRQHDAQALRKLRDDRSPGDRGVLVGHAIRPRPHEVRQGREDTQKGARRAA